MLRVPKMFSLMGGNCGRFFFYPKTLGFLGKAKTAYAGRQFIPFNSWCSDHVFLWR
jgi:hypothetical protein